MRTTATAINSLSLRDSYRELIESSVFVLQCKYCDSSDEIRCHRYNKTVIYAVSRTQHASPARRRFLMTKIDDLTSGIKPFSTCNL